MEYITHNGGSIYEKGYTIDHLFPKSMGYSKNGNSVLACRRCNELKGNSLPTKEQLLKASNLYHLMGRIFVLNEAQVLDYLGD